MQLILVVLAACMWSVHAAVPNRTNIDGQIYEVTIVLRDVYLWHNIIVDKEDTKFLTIHVEDKLYTLKNNETELKQVQGIPNDVKVQDIAMDDSGDIIIATERRGFYKRTSPRSRASLFIKNKNLITYWMGKSRNGTIFGVNSRDQSLFYLDGSETRTVLDIEGVGAFTYVDNDDLYYFDNRNRNFTVRRAGQVESILLTGIRSQVNTYIMAFDKKTNKVFVGTNDGLYFLTPPSTVFTSVNEFFEVTSIGFDANDNIYLGSDREFLLKLEPVPRRFIMN